LRNDVLKTLELHCNKQVYLKAGAIEQRSHRCTAAL